MTSREYNAEVEAGRYPEDPTVPVDDVFRNDAGEILNLVFHRDEKARPSGVEVIHSKKHALRSNHYHKTDWHYMYVISGEMTYFWRPVGPEYERVEPKVRVYRQGELMFTPPMMEHATYFGEDTVLLVVSHNVRDKASHEADLVRKQLVTLEFTPTGAPVLRTL